MMTQLQRKGLDAAESHLTEVSLKLSKINTATRPKEIDLLTVDKLIEEAFREIGEVSAWIRAIRETK